MEVTPTLAAVPPTPAANRLCDGWGREQENCADRTNQTSQTRSDSARTRQVQIGNKSMFVKVNRPSSSVEGHPYIHWYTQRAFVNLLAETKSRRKCVECQKDLQRAPEIDRKSTRLNSQSLTNLVCRLLLEKKK